MTRRARRGFLAVGAGVVAASTLAPWTRAGVVADRNGISTARSLIAGAVVTEAGGVALGFGLLALPALAALVWAALALGIAEGLVTALGIVTAIATATLVVIVSLSLGATHVGPPVAAAGSAILVIATLTGRRIR